MTSRQFTLNDFTPSSPPDAPPPPADQPIQRPLTLAGAPLVSCLPALTLGGGAEAMARPSSESDSSSDIPAGRPSRTFGIVAQFLPADEAEDGMGKRQAAYR